MDPSLRHSGRHNCEGGVDVELALFLASALAMCLKDTADMRRAGSASDIPAYLAALAAVALAGAAFVLSSGCFSAIRAIVGIFA
jgi:hypothetical protein